jgi:hypothetical protein
MCAKGDGCCTTMNESVNEESKTIKSIQNLADKNKYGTVSGTRMNGKTAREIIAIYNHPKMKSFRGKMDKMKSQELMDLTIRLPRMLGIKVESVNEKVDKIGRIKKEFPWAKGKMMNVIQMAIEMDADGLAGVMKNYKKNPSAYKQFVRDMSKMRGLPSLEEMKDAMKNAIHQVKTFDKPSNAKLMTIKVINKLKQKRNSSKSASNKKELQKMIDKVEGDYKKGKYIKESLNEVSGVEVAKKVLKNKQHEKGIDLQTANLIVTIDKAYNKNPRLQKKFRAIQLPKMKQLILKYFK